MPGKLRSHLRSNVVGYVAVVVALIGVPTAWAVAINSVGSRQIKPGGVKASDVATGAVVSRAIQNGSLGPRDLRAQGEGITEPRVFVRIEKCRVTMPSSNAIAASN